MSDQHWTFLSNYAHVLVCLAQNPAMRLRDVAHSVGITERSAQRLIAHLSEAGILIREKQGRCNTYLINTDAHLRHPLEATSTVGEFLKIFLSPARVRKLAQSKEAFDEHVSK